MSRSVLASFVFSSAILMLVVGCDPSGGPSPTLVPEQEVSNSGDSQNADVETEPDTSEWEGVKLPLACADIYSQDFIPTFEIEIEPQHWDQLVAWYKLGPDAVDENPETYVPLVSFRYGQEVITDAMIRLRGNPFHWWPDPKMQFNISFKQVREKGRFHGLRKINLDVAHNDLTLFHDRLGSSIFHDMGLPAPCVNHARLVINGEFFGLYVNIEHVDQEFLRRNFGPYAGGNLYKSKPHFLFEKKTNESDPDWSDIEEFQNPDLTLEQLVDLLDMDEALLEWAAEAVVPHLDGYFVGGSNYQLYNHPMRGFVFIPWDLDYVFEIGDPMSDPIAFECAWGRGKPLHMVVALADPEMRDAYLDALDEALDHFDPDLLSSRIEFYAEQVRDALEVDPNLEYSLEEHYEAVELLHEFLKDRRSFLEGWMPCGRRQLDVESVSLDDEEFALVVTECSRDVAVGICEDLGGELAIPENQKEQDFLAAQIVERGEDDWWIAPTDLESEGLWTDLHGNPLETVFWADEQPYEHDWINCAVMEEYYGGRWAVDYCTIPYSFICRLY